MRWIWIDKFIEFDSGHRAVAVKNVTLAEEHLHDHFPGFPVMPETLMIESMADAAVRMGIPKEKAIKIAAQITLGTSKLIIDTEEHPAKIKDRVATPGGVTVEGLLELEKGGLRANIISAISKAGRRVSEIEKEIQPK